MLILPALPSEFKRSRFPSVYHINSVRLVYTNDKLIVVHKITIKGVLTSLATLSDVVRAVYKFITRKSIIKLTGTTCIGTLTY